MGNFGLNVPGSAAGAVAYVGPPIDVTVQLATDASAVTTTKANDLIAAFANPLSAPAQARAMLVPTIAEGDGSGVVIAMVKQTLSGGSNPSTQASFTTAVAGGNNDLKWTAGAAAYPGAAGNVLTIAYLNNGVSKPLAISVGGVSGLRLQVKSPGADGNGVFRVQVLVGPTLAVSLSDRVLTITVLGAGSLVGDIATLVNSSQDMIAADVVGWSGSVTTGQGLTTFGDGRDALLADKGDMVVSPDFTKLYIAMQDIRNPRDSNAVAKWRSIALNAA